MRVALWMIAGFRGRTSLSATVGVEDQDLRQHQALTPFFQKLNRILQVAG